MKSIIDRFEGDYAILLVGEDEIQVDFPKELLPPGSKEGSWLNIDMELDPEGEQGQREKIKGMLDRLKEKS